MMKAWLDTTIRSLVDHPESVRISALDGGRTTILEVRCHPEDVGKVIGRNGKTISALRTILATRAARDKRQIVLEVVE